MHRQYIWVSELLDGYRGMPSLIEQESQCVWLLV